MSNQLPERPNLDHLREQAKDLLKAYRSGDALATETLSAVSQAPHSLSHAQLAVARSYGFVSWPALVKHVETIRANQGIDQEAVNRFVELALSDRTETLRRHMELYPGLPRFDPVCAALAGEEKVLRDWITPENVNEPIGPEGWQPIEYVCWSKVHLADPSRYQGQLACGRLLLEAGANPNASHLFGDDAPLPVLYGASCEAGHVGLVRLLLEHGAKPDDGESVYHAAQMDRREILDVLLEFNAEISAVHPHWGNTPLYFLSAHRPTDPQAASAMRGMEWLLEHGADPNIPCPRNGETPLHSLCAHGWGRAMIEMFLRHGADPNLRRHDGRTSYVLAAVTGSREAAETLREHGADASLSPEESLLSLCARGVPPPNSPRIENPSDEVCALFVRLAELGRTGAIEVLLSLGMPIDARGEAGATALHYAGYCGWAEVIKVLLKHGAPLDLRDFDYEATPLGWVLHGMGNNRNAKGDYVQAIRLLLAAGADRGEVLAWMDEGDSPPDLEQVLN